MVNVLFILLLVLGCVAAMAYIRKTIHEMNESDVLDDEDLEDPWDL